MNTLKKILWAAIVTAVGKIIYEAISQTRSSVREEPEPRRQKNRHLNPVFSKLKDLQSTPQE